MALKYSLNIDTKNDLTKWRQSTIADPAASTASDVATSLAAIIDVLQYYQLVATA